MLSVLIKMKVMEGKKTYSNVISAAAVSGYSALSSPEIPQYPILKNVFPVLPVVSGPVSRCFSEADPVRV